MYIVCCWESHPFDLAKILVEASSAVKHIWTFLMFHGDFLTSKMASGSSLRLWIRGYSRDHLPVNSRKALTSHFHSNGSNCQPFLVARNCNEASSVHLAADFGPCGQVSIPRPRGGRAAVGGDQQDTGAVTSNAFYCAIGFISFGEFC